MITVPLWLLLLLIATLGLTSLRLLWIVFTTGDKSVTDTRQE